MHLRSLQPEDTAPVLEMWNATARFDPLTPGLFEEKTRGDEGFSPELAVVCVDSDCVRGFAMGVIRDTPDGPRGVVKLLAAAADRRRCGIGSALLRRVEEAMAGRGVRTIRVCESAPNYLTPGVDCRYSAAPYFFERQGYRRIGEACNMSVELSGRAFANPAMEKSFADQGIDLRRARSEDREAITTMLSSHWPSWRAEADKALENDPVTLFIAVTRAEVLGFAAWDANNRGTGWFGPMGTVEAERGQGIGRALLFHCLDDMVRGDVNAAIIPWVDPVGFYRQCAGAAVSRVFNRYEKESTA
ncbi:MAG: GNAT family N-acetyltransferase [Xanthomonadales bacterium]|nr:GNAT family N-acetyltransferase [Gammaproteobacteria bacterium]MBT8052053.1 GNAT family N-acetyltransferase [Gammaproteobacteria bacterium]NNJ78465.1 GNAT family N-acetyltransferase [Xanthomonadales bacterium]NNL05102.1 GNAT family N-acetyltransferase [Xanthomonadales bacterium]